MRPATQRIRCTHTHMRLEGAPALSPSFLPLIISLSFRASTSGPSRYSHLRWWVVGCALIYRSLLERARTFQRRVRSKLPPPPPPQMQSLVSPPRLAKCCRLCQCSRATTPRAGVAGPHRGAAAEGCCFAGARLGHPLAQCALMWRQECWPGCTCHG